MYQRIVLELSGEAFAGECVLRLNAERVSSVAVEIAAIQITSD
jgi:uridylate kinase